MIQILSWAVIVLLATVITMGMAMLYIDSKNKEQ